MTKKKKHKVHKYLVVITLVLYIGCLKMQAQQDAQYTQYMYNTTSVNPAYAGSRGHLTLAGLYRAQWVGLEGAPKTQTFTVHSPVGYNGVGLGISIVNDNIGPTSETYFDADFAYAINVGENTKINFGLKASAHLLDVDFTQLYLGQGNTFDNTGIPTNIDNKFSPNIGAGIYYHSQQFYLGLSVPRFLETEHFESSSLSTANEEMNWYFMTGYVAKLNPFLKFKPAALIKAVSGAPLQVDLSTNFLFNDKFLAGVNYRWRAAVSGIAGFQINDQFFLGLSYDRETTDLGAATFNDGSIEIVLRFDLIEKMAGLKSPRFF